MGGAMAEYRFCFFGNETQSSTNCLVDADNDDEARFIGRELLSDTTFTLIEVWCKNRLVLYTDKPHFREWT
jgi:hypothetical protein